MVFDIGELEQAAPPVTLDGIATKPEIKEQLAQRDANELHRTAVISLSAKLLGIEETEADYIASVEFTGVIQETVGEQAEPFEEVWNMTKSKSQGGWLLAGIQTRE